MPNLSHLFLDSNNITKLIIKRSIKNIKIVNISCDGITDILLFNISSIYIYIELLASKGAIKPNLLLSISTNIIEAIQ